MRHISTLIAAVLVAPSAWLLLSVGQDSSADFVRTVACLASAGLLLGLLATLRFSPLGVLVTGAGYAAAGLALLVAPAGVLGLFPHSLTVVGRAADPATPLRTGTALLLGTLLVGVAIGAGRPRRVPSAEPEQDQSLSAAGSCALPSARDLEAMFANRHPGGPRNRANVRPNSYAPPGKGAERWMQTRQSAWPVE